VEAGTAPGRAGRAAGSLMTKDLFREIEHTADLAVVVEAADLPGLFARAGLSLFALLVSPEAVEPAEHRRVEVEGRDQEDLLHEWLSRLLSDFYVHGFVAASIRVVLLDKIHLEAELEGERFDRSRHSLLREIKAVTYHDLAIRHTTAGCEAQVTFDV